MSKTLSAALTLIGAALLACQGEPAWAQPPAQTAPCKVSIPAVETLVLEETLDQVAARLGCPGALTSVHIMADDLRLHTRVWRIDAWPYGRLEGEFINGELHGMTKTWLNLSINY
ncbi:MAG: hypothetical protein R3D57_01320 [Hyphomicrobiaceae bacterium]